MAIGIIIAAIVVVGAVLWFLGRRRAGSSRRDEPESPYHAGLDSMIAGDRDAAIVTFVVAASGGEPTILFEHWSPPDYRWSPDGQWIASGAGSEVRLWPMPDLTRPPLHTLPLDGLLAKRGADRPVGPKAVKELVYACKRL